MCPQTIFGPFWGRGGLWLLCHQSTWHIHALCYVILWYESNACFLGPSVFLFVSFSRFCLFHVTTWVKSTTAPCQSLRNPGCVVNSYLPYIPCSSIYDNKNWLSISSHFVTWSYINFRIDIVKFHIQSVWTKSAWFHAQDKVNPCWWVLINPCPLRSMSICHDKVSRLNVKHRWSKSQRPTIID